MDKKNIAALALAAALGGGATTLATNALASSNAPKRIAVVHELMRRSNDNDGGIAYYITTTAVDRYPDGGQALAAHISGIVLDADQYRACETYWDKVVEPSLTAKLGKIGGQ